MLSSILQKIPFIAVGVMLIVAGVIIYIRSKNVTRSEFFRIFKKIFWIQTYTQIAESVGARYFLILVVYITKHYTFTDSYSVLIK